MSESTIVSIAKFLFRRNGISRAEFELHKKAVRYIDTCEATHDGLKETLDAKFEGMKELMDTRFDTLETLVKNNGHSTPRIRT